MYYSVEIACVLSEVWMIHWLLKSMFSLRNQPRWVGVVLYGGYCCVLAALSFMHDISSFVRIGLNLGIIWCLGCVLFSVNPFRSLFASLIVCALAVFADVLASSLLLRFGFSIDSLMQAGSQRSVYLILTHILLFALIACVTALFPSRKENISMKLLILVLPCWLCSALLCMILAKQLFQEKMISPLYLFILLGLLYTDILFVYQIQKISIQEREKQEGTLAEHHYAMQQAYYDQFRIQQEETRALWHDISKLIRGAKLEGSTEALEQVEEMLHSVETVVDVDNRVVSVILNEYAREADHASIRLDMDVQISEELPITAADLYILLGNTLENAIEACCALPPEDRVIVLRLKLHNHILFYKISNPYTPSYPERTRGELHGYGLQNVRKCVEKHKGTMEIEKENQTFCFVAHLNM